MTVALAVCTGPFVLCAAFREVSNSPMMVYEGLAFHSLAPSRQEDRARMYASLKFTCQLTSGPADVMKMDCPSSSSPLIVATNHPLNAAQVLWQSGTSIPVVRFHGLYTGAYHTSV